MCVYITGCYGKTMPQTQNWTDRRREVVVPAKSLIAGFQSWCSFSSLQSLGRKSSRGYDNPTHVKDLVVELSRGELHRKALPFAKKQVVATFFKFHREPL